MGLFIVASLDSELNFDSRVHVDRHLYQNTALLILDKLSVSLASEDKVAHRQRIFI